MLLFFFFLISLTCGQQNITDGVLVNYSTLMLQDGSGFTAAAVVGSGQLFPVFCSSTLIPQHGPATVACNRFGCTIHSANEKGQWFDCVWDTIPTMFSAKLYPNGTCPFTTGNDISCQNVAEFSVCCDPVGNQFWPTATDL
jgi:hypothetical protein